MGMATIGRVRISLTRALNEFNSVFNADKTPCSCDRLPSTPTELNCVEELYGNPASARLNKRKRNCNLKKNNTKIFTT